MQKPDQPRQYIFWIIVMALNVVVIACLLYFFTPAKPPGVGIYQSDDRYGYVHKPNTMGTQLIGETQVTYTIDNRGQRLAPGVSEAKGRILFLGGSFTFGAAVDDEATFPYLLGARYWPEWEISNRAVNAWSTSHAYMALLEEIAVTDPPSMVIYGFMSHHIMRNYIRESWVESLGGRGHPHFELEDGEIRFREVIHEDQAAAGGSELLAKEIELTSAFLIQMQKHCKKAGIPFVVVWLPQKEASYQPAALLATFQTHEIPLLKLTDLKIDAFPNNVHPNVNDYVRIADAIANSFITDVLNSIED